MNRIKVWFTKWYIKRGYTFWHDFVRIDENITRMKARYNCPLWVKPLLIFFSPSVYNTDVILPRLKRVLIDIIDSAEEKNNG